MLNNNGPPQNEAFPFPQFGQPHQSSLAGAQGVYGNHNNGAQQQQQQQQHKRLGGGNGLAGQQPGMASMQRQNNNQRGGGGAAGQLPQQQQQQQFAGQQQQQQQQQQQAQQQAYQAQHRAAGNLGNQASAFGTALGTLNRTQGGGYAQGGGQPSGRASNSSLAPGGGTLPRLAVPGQGQKGGRAAEMEMYAQQNQAMQQHAAQQRGGVRLHGDQSAAMRGTGMGALANQLLHPSQQHPKAPPANGQPPSAAQQAAQQAAAFGKPGDPRDGGKAPAGFGGQHAQAQQQAQQQGRIPGYGPHGQLPPKAGGDASIFLGAGALGAGGGGGGGAQKAPIGNGLFPTSDSDKVFGDSDFPALGMGAALGGALADRDPLDAAASAAAFHDQFSVLGISGKPGGKPLDKADFPALMPGLRSLGAGAALSHARGGGGGGGPESFLPPGDPRAGAAKPRSDSGAILLPPKGESEAERYGLMGLLPVIRMSEPDVTTLSLGIDLQTLGLNLNAADSLHRSFGSPWSDQGRPGALTTKLPSCYLFPPQPLDAACLQRFTNLSVFFVFYAFAGEEKQLLAGEELTIRGWYFHKQLQVWMKPEKTKQINSNGVVGEQGLFKFFDVATSSIAEKDDMFMDYRMCEDRPSGGPPTVPTAGGVLSPRSDVTAGGQAGPGRYK